jgi:hypothetical protein
MAQGQNKLADLRAALLRLQSPLADVADLTTSPDGDGVPDFRFCHEVAQQADLAHLLMTLQNHIEPIVEFSKCVLEEVPAAVAFRKGLAAAMARAEAVAASARAARAAEQEQAAAATAAAAEAASMAAAQAAQAAVQEAAQGAPNAADAMQE